MSLHVFSGLANTQRQKRLLSVWAYQELTQIFNTALQLIFWYATVRNILDSGA